MDSAETHSSQPVCEEQIKSGRLYIPHGYGKEKPFIPHINHQEVAYSECGPDWKSRLRWLPSPKPKEGESDQNTFFPPMTSIRHYPYQHNISYKDEYSFYPPHGSAKFQGRGKKTIFNKEHKASLTSQIELSDSLQFGNRGIPASSRNGISEASPGDKPYQAAEYSPGFHRIGSTRPVVNFGKPYIMKEAERRRTDEIDIVRSLNTWKPAPPLVVPIYESRSAA